MKRVVVGVTGLPGAGKDTVAEHLVADYGFKRFAFADEVYREVAEAFNVTVEFLRARVAKEAPSPLLTLCGCRDMSFCEALLELHGELSFSAPRSPRWILQQWATEYRRGQNPEYWVLKLVEQVLAEPTTTPVVISDVRFENEANAVRMLGAMSNGESHVWHVTRSTDSKTAHASDDGLDFKYITACLPNNTSIEDLGKRVDRLLLTGRYD